MSKDARTPPPEDVGLKLGTLKWTPHNELRVRWKTYKGSEYLDIRLWNDDNKFRDFWPTKKGLSVSPCRFDDFRAAMMDVFKKVDEILEADQLQPPD